MTPRRTDHDSEVEQLLPLLLTPQLLSVELELTTSCPCRCITCGSNCGRAADDELTTSELCVLLEEAKVLGGRRLTFLGGEPLCRPDLMTLIRRAKSCGLLPEVVTSGIGLSQEVARQLGAAGATAVTVSVDGCESSHDAQRGVRGAFQQALAAIRALDVARIPVGVTTQVNQLSLPELEAMGDMLLDAGAISWQLQTTLPIGRATDSRLVLAESDMPALLSTLRRLAQRHKLAPYITDNIGWWTADDAKLRSTRGGLPRCWLGCSAGLRHVGITSTGNVKGCLALGKSYIEGNVRVEPFTQIWQDLSRFAYNRKYTPDSLTGACARCAKAPLCRGGCIAASVAHHGQPGMNTRCLQLLERS